MVSGSGQEYFLGKSYNYGCKVMKNRIQFIMRNYASVFVSKLIFCFLSANLILLASLNTLAQSIDTEIEVEVNFQTNYLQNNIIAKGILPLDISLPFPSAKSHAVKYIDDAIPVQFIDYAREIVVDSISSINDWIKYSPVLQSSLFAVADNPQLRKVSMDSILQNVTVEYQLPFYGPNGLMRNFVTHSRLATLPVTLGFYPSREFSGIVIYAKGEVPVWGTDKVDKLTPALLPKIYNDELELIASPFMADPKMLNRWGFVVYTNSVDEQEFIQRIGNYPFRTMLRSIYGVNNTDLIITKDVALKLLSSRDNDRIIREGRILIIIDPQN